MRCDGMGGYISVSLSADKDEFVVIVKVNEQLEYISGFDTEDGESYSNTDPRKARKYTKSVAKRIVDRLGSQAIGYLKV